MLQDNPLNSIHATIAIKQITFTSLEEINQYIELTVTTRAELYAKMIHPYIRAIDEKSLYYYNSESKLWSLMCKSDFLNYTFSFFNATIIHITKQFECTFVKALTSAFDKRKYIEDIASRAYSFLKDPKFVLKLDSSPHLFPLKDGKKINLKTLEVSERTYDDYMTFESPVSFLPDDPLTHANKFFKSIMTNNEEREYMRKVLGYTITGETCARSFFIWYGHGSNGKSKVFEFVKAILANQYHQCDKSIFMKTKMDSKGASPELVALMNKRACVYSEGETSDQLDMNLCTIKQISGEDTLNARQLYSQPIEFKPYCKLHMLTNFTPGLNEEKAIVTRIRYIFLDNEFQTQDYYNNKGIKKRESHQHLINKQFMDELTNVHLSEIFTWIAKGAHEFYTDMQIVMPSTFEARTKELFESEDSLSTFITRKIKYNPDRNVFVRKGDLFERYKQFCDTNSQRCCRRSQLFDRLKEKGLRTSVKDGYEVYRNMSIDRDESIDNEITMDCDDEYKHAYNELLAKYEKLKRSKLEQFKDLSIKLDYCLESMNVVYEDSLKYKKPEPEPKPKAKKTIKTPFDSDDEDEENEEDEEEEEVGISHKSIMDALFNDL